MGWLYEVKFDGYRMQAHKPDATVNGADGTGVVAKHKLGIYKSGRSMGRINVKCRLGARGTPTGGSCSGSSARRLAGRPAPGVPPEPLTLILALPGQRSAGAEPDARPRRSLRGLARLSGTRPSWPARLSGTRATRPSRPAWMRTSWPTRPSRLSGTRPTRPSRPGGGREEGRSRRSYRGRARCARPGRAPPPRRGRRVRGATTRRTPRRDCRGVRAGGGTGGTARGACCACCACSAMCVRPASPASPGAGRERGA